MHSNKYNHAWYRFRNVCNFENLEEQNDLIWTVKAMIASKVLIGWDIVEKWVCFDDTVYQIVTLQQVNKVHHWIFDDGMDFRECAISSR